MTAKAPADKVVDIGLGGITVLPDRMRQLRPEAVAKLVESMGAADGRLLHPIGVRPKPRGGLGYILVYGWHRLMAARALKWDSIRATVLDGISADEALLMEIDENLVRADLTSIEQDLHVARRKELYEQAHPEVKHGGSPGKAGGGKKAKERTVRSFVKDTAKKTGVHKATVTRSAARGTALAKIPNGQDAIGTSLDTPSESAALVLLPAPVQQKIIKRAKAGEKVSAKTEFKKLIRQDRERSLAVRTAAAATALGQEIPASVVLADPALKFKVYSEHGEDRSAANHYPTGPVEEMIALKPPMAKDCVVFMWTSAPWLRKSITILEAWGLTYKSYVRWDKEIDGTGYWARSRHELVLIATQGKKIPAPAGGEQIPHMRSRRGRHSEKPVELYEAIERLYPNLVKLEMFARKSRPGWRPWGNEVVSAP